MQAAVVVTSSCAVCLCGEIRRDGSYAILSEATVPYPGLRRGRPVSSFGLQTAISEVIDIAQENTKGRIKQIYVGVPGAFCRLSINHPIAVSPNDAGEYAPPEQHEYMSDEADLIHRLSCPASGEAKMGRRMMVSIMADKAYVAEINDALKHKGMRQTSLISQNYVEGLFLIPRVERDKVAVLLDIGYYNADVCVFHGDAQIYGETLYVGGAHVVSDLAQVLDIDRNYAEQLKKQFAFGIQYEPDAQDFVRLDSGKLRGFDHNMVDEIVRSRLDETCVLIRQALEDSGIAFSQAPRAYLTGDGLADVRGIREYLSSQIGFRFEALPLHMSDGATRYHTAALAMMEYIAHNDTEGPPRKSQGINLGKIFGRK